MLTPIAGRSVIVTGASKGIGKGLARTFAQKGANVIVVGRDAEQAGRTAAEIAASGGAASAFAADVTQPAQMESMAAYAIEKHGGIECLVRECHGC